MGHTKWSEIRRRKIRPGQEAAVAAGVRALRDALALGPTEDAPLDAAEAAAWNAASPPTDTRLRDLLADAVRQADLESLAVIDGTNVSAAILATDAGRKLAAVVETAEDFRATGTLGHAAAIVAALDAAFGAER